MRIVYCVDQKLKHIFMCIENTGKVCAGRQACRPDMIFDCIYIVPILNRSYLIALFMEQV